MLHIYIYIYIYIYDISSLRVNPAAGFQTPTQVRRIKIAECAVCGTDTFLLLRNVRQNPMRGTLRVIMRGFRCAVSTIFSSFSTFRRTWLSAWRFALWKEPFSLRRWCTQVNTRLSGIRRRRHHCRFSSTATARYKMHIIVIIIKKARYSNFSLRMGHAAGGAVDWGTALPAGR